MREFTRISVIGVVSGVSWLAKRVPGKAPVGMRYAPFIQKPSKALGIT